MCPVKREKDEDYLTQDDNKPDDYIHRPGKLYLVGIGSGNSRQITPQAQDAILKAEVVVGYGEYLKLIKNLLAYKLVLSSGMCQEVDRAELAIQEAQNGKMVAVISSGDAGIYGMAGLVLGILQKKKLDVAVEVVPGITAASLASASLGAPLMNDFAVISLSDLLTPWAVIEKRLQSAAQGDWVIVVYNPKSNHRTTQIEHAQAILLQHRRPDTPVGIVQKAGRDDEKRIISTLANFLKEPIDMSTTVIIGNSQTIVYNNMLITPRGYQI